MCNHRGRRRRVGPWRRLVQLAVLALLILVPFLSQNPMESSPSRIILGQVHQPPVVSVTGDTWDFTAGPLHLTHPLAFIELILSSKVLYLSLILSVWLPLVATLILGRVFCSWQCPVGFLLELNQKLNRWLRGRGLASRFRIRDYRYPVLFISLALALLLAVPVISLIDPPHILGRELMYLFTHHGVSLSGVVLLGGIFLMELFLAPRALCNSLCPSGGALALIGARRPLRIHLDPEACTRCGLCDKACPVMLAPMAMAAGGGFDWTKCDNCGLCRDVCPEGAIRYVFGGRRPVAGPGRPGLGGA